MDNISIKVAEKIQDILKPSISFLYLGQFNHPTNYQPRSFNNNNNQFYPQNNFYLPTSFRPRNFDFLLKCIKLSSFLGLENQNFANGNNKRPYPQNNNNNYYNQRQSWPNKKPRYDHPSPYQQPSSSSNRMDYRYVANQNSYQQRQQFQ
jgi:hypothetical protein